MVTPLIPGDQDLCNCRFEAINNGNYVVHGLLYEIVIKENYWVRAENDTAGNSIDFLVKIKGMTFYKAMNMLLS